METTITNQNTENKVWRVSKDTSAISLGSAIAHCVEEHGRCEISTSGSDTLRIAVKAIIKARSFAVQGGRDLAAFPNYATLDYADEAGRPYSGLSFVIKPAALQ